MIKAIYWIIAVCICIYLYWYVFYPDSENMNVVKIMEMILDSFPFFSVANYVYNTFWVLLIIILSISWPLSIILFKVIMNGVTVIESDSDQTSGDENLEKVESE